MKSKTKQIIITTLFALLLSSGFLLFMPGAVPAASAASFSNADVQTLFADEAVFQGTANLDAAASVTYSGGVVTLTPVDDNSGSVPYPPGIFSYDTGLFSSDWAGKGISFDIDSDAASLSGYVGIFIQSDSPFASFSVQFVLKENNRAKGTVFVGFTPEMFADADALYLRFSFVWLEFGEVCTLSNFRVNEKPLGADVDAPTLNYATANEIIINPVAVPGNGQSVEYSLGYFAPYGNWQDSLIFPRPTVAQPMRIFARAKENASFYPGMFSEPLEIYDVTTLPVTNEIERIFYSGASVYAVGNPSSGLSFQSPDKLTIKQSLGPGYWATASYVTGKIFENLIGKTVSFVFDANILIPEIVLAYKKDSGAAIAIQTFSNINISGLLKISFRITADMFDTPASYIQLQLIFPTPIYNYEIILSNIRIRSDGAAVPAPALQSKTETTITLKEKPPLPNGQTAEFAIFNSAEFPVLTWQDSPAFDGLSENTIYFFFARAKENEYFRAGLISSALGVLTNSSIPEPPPPDEKAEGAEAPAPTLWDKTETTVELNEIPQLDNGQFVEFAIYYNGELSEWQDSPIFDGLSENTMYFFFARAKENDVFLAGEISEALEVTTDGGGGITEPEIEVIIIFLFAESAWSGSPEEFGAEDVPEVSIPEGKEFYQFILTGDDIEEFAASAEELAAFINGIEVSGEIVVGVEFKDEEAGGGNGTEPPKLSWFEKYGYLFLFGGVAAALIVGIVVAIKLNKPPYSRRTKEKELRGRKKRKVEKEIEKYII